MEIDDFGTDVKEISNIEKELQEKEAAQGEAPNHACMNDVFNFSQWLVLANRSFKPASKTNNKLPNGFYEIELDNYGEVIFIQKTLFTDELMIFDDTAQSISDEIMTFWEKIKVFKDYGFCHRRGYLFYGRAGTGKTSIIKQVLQQIIGQGGIAINCNIRPDISVKAINRLRMIEPDRKLLCIFEDIDAIINRFGEEKILSLLDGEDLTDNVLNIATTNYPEKLDKRIVSRPRRFDRIIKITDPDESVRRKYFKEKLKLNSDELDKYVAVSHGFTFASLSDLVISTKCLGMPIENAVQRLKELEKRKSSDEYESKIGII